VHGDPPDNLDAPNDDGDEDGPLRGWVPPDDRLWLHPSERAAHQSAAAPRPAATRPAVGRWVTGGVAACVVVTVVVVGVVLATAGESQQGSAPTGTWVTGVPTTEAGMGVATTARELTAVADPAHGSTVALLVHQVHRTLVATGIVAEAGGIVVALEPVLAGARSVTVVEPDGTRDAAMTVGTDRATGITVLRIDDDLPAATFTDEDPGTGSVAVAMAEGTRSGTRSTPVLHLYAGTVLYAGVATDTWQGTEFCTTGVDTALTPGDLGSPLVDDTGAVTGILDGVVDMGSRPVSVFLPAELVEDVTAQIVDHGSVDHGTLDADMAPPSGSGVSGAEVTSVTPDGAAAQAGLRPGDVVEAVDGQGLRSVAELDTRLYGDPPGSQLRLTVRRDGITFQTVVVLTDD
jgi:S1-C subfamily serine protease